MDDQIESLYLKKYDNQKTHLCIPGIRQWLDEFLIILFPVMGQSFLSSFKELKSLVDQNKAKFVKILECQIQGESQCANKTANDIYKELFDLEKRLGIDIDFFLESDPATSDRNEVIIAYPGFYAIACYRISHIISKMNFPLVARMISEIAHQKTGVDIHPKATIGSPFFIDHATGIVIGETTVIGKRVSLYQGVTLGALKVHKKMKGIKRHPSVEDDCIIYANATILGGETVIGKGSVIGGNVWLAKSVPPESHVYNESKVIIKS